MPLSVRDARMFKRRYESYLKILRELNIERADEVAALLTVAEILSHLRSLDVDLASPQA